MNKWVNDVTAQLAVPWCNLGSSEKRTHRPSHSESLSVKTLQLIIAGTLKPCYTLLFFSYSHLVAFRPSMLLLQGHSLARAETILATTFLLENKAEQNGELWFGGCNFKANFHKEGDLDLCFNISWVGRHFFLCRVWENSFKFNMFKKYVQTKMNP